MKSIKFLASNTSLAILLALLAAGPVQPRAAAADIPFHLDGTFTFTYLRGNIFTVSGDGHAAPGGNFIFRDTVRVEYGGPQAMVEGMITLVFASGTLTFCYEAPIEHIDGVPVVEGPYWVVDGTGLFKGASGSGVIWYPIGQGAPFTMDGTLSW